MKTFLTLVAAGLIGLGTTANAALLDAFDDTDGTNWTDIDGTTTHNGSVLTGTSFSRSIINGVTGTSFSVDVGLTSAVGYVAFVMQNSSGPDLFLKVQDNGGPLGFDSFGFYTDNNTNSAGIYSGSQNFVQVGEMATSGTFSASIVGSQVTLSFGGFTETRTLTPSFTSSGVGLGFWQNSTADNFSSDALAPVPLPAGGALLLTALGMFALHRRRQSV